MSDESIAAVLNRSGKATGRGNSWTCTLLLAGLLPRYGLTRRGESSECGEVTVHEAAAALAVSPSTIRRMISDGMLQAQHHCEGAPWIICFHDLKRTDVRTEAERRRSRRPLSRDSYQRSFDL